MVGTLHRRIWRVLTENKGRSFGVIALVFLGSFYFVAATGVAGNLEQMVVGFAEAYQQEDLTFSTDTPIADVAGLERESGARIEAYRQYDVKLPDGELRLLSANTKVNLPAVTSGRGLANPGDILLDASFSRVRGLQPGNHLELDGKTYTIAGAVAVPNYVYILENLYDVLPTSGFGVGIVSGADLEAYPAAEAVYAVRFEHREGLAGQTTKLHGLLNQKGYSVSEWLDRKGNKRISMPWGNISSLKSMSLPVSSAFSLLGCLVVCVMIVRMVKADGVVIGTLYAQGYRRGELVRHYLTVPILVSAAGGLAGVLLAVPCVRPVVESMLTSYNLPPKDITFSPVELALAIAMPVALVASSSYLVMRRLLGKSAVELMKGADQKAELSFLERALRLERFAFATRFRIRQQVRSIPRLVFLVLGVSVASMTLLYGLSYRHSMDVVMNEGALARYVYPLEYNFKETQNLQRAALPDGAEPYNALRCYPEGRESVEFYLVGMEPDSVGFKVNDRRGDALPRDQVNISSPLAARLKVEPGDRVHLVNKLDGKTYSLTIDGLVEAYGEQFVFMPLEAFNRLTGQPPGSYRTVLAAHELEFDKSLLAGVMDARDRDAYEELGGPTTAIVVSLTVLSVLIAVIIIFLVTSLMIDESRNTISLLAVLGYRREELAKLILNSATPLVLVGFWLGLPLMLVLANGISNYVAEIINMVIPVKVSPLHVLMSFALIFATYELTKWMCAKRLAQISMSEALKAGTE
jgi:putative ABC transport system permease protein